MLSSAFSMRFHHPHNQQNHHAVLQNGTFCSQKAPGSDSKRTKLLYRIPTPIFKSKLKIILPFHFTAGKPKSPQRELASINIHVYKYQLKLGLKERNETRNTAQQKDILSLQLTRQVCCPRTRSSALNLSSGAHCLLLAY